MELNGSIVQFKSRINASGDTINTVSLEVHGNVEAIHGLMQKPVRIKIEELRGPFEE